MRYYNLCNFCMNQMKKENDDYQFKLDGSYRSPSNQYATSLNDQQKLYRSEKFLSKAPTHEKQANSKLTSEQIMNNLNVSFDGLFSKIQALKQGYTFKGSTQLDISTQFKKPNDLSQSISNKPKSQLFLKTDITKSARILKPPSQLIENQGNKEEPVQQKKPVEWINPFQNIIPNNNMNEATKIKPIEKPQNAFVNAQKKQFNPIFGFDKLMNIPSLKASINFPDQQYETRPATSESKLDAVVDKMNGGSMLKKATKQSIIIKSQIVQEFQTLNMKLKINDFQLGKCVGSGKFGDVFICRHKQTGCIFALKKIFKSTIQQYDMVKQFTRELRIHYLLNNPNIIKLYTHFQDDYHIFLVMEYAEGGILMDRLQCGEQQASRYVAQAINAVEYLHQLFIAHRDIKPENIVVQFGSVIKLCDFGWSSFYSNEMKTTFCGTLDYLSPEMKEKGQYDNSVDIWSLGVLTYELLIGKAPFQKQITNWKKGGGQRSDKWNWNIYYPNMLSTISESFMRNLLKQKPEDRSTLRFCANHMFIKRHNEPIQQNKYYEEFSKIV